MEDKEWQRLARYYSGEAAPEEEAEIRRWLEEDPERARIAESLRTVWDLSATMPPQHHGDARRVWDRVVEEAHAGRATSAAVESTLPATERFRRLREPRRGLAAAYLLAAAAIVLIVLVPFTRGSFRGLLGGGEVAEAAVREYSTGEGERLTFSLDDGSVVDLGPNSTLRAPTPFPGGPREVHLDGMAQFNVVADAARPFVVRAGAAVTRVLGTRFVVRAYSTESAVRVAVVEGQVAVGPSSSGAEGATVLGQGQLGQVAGGGVIRVLQDEDDFTRLVQWTTGRLEFIDQPLAEVLSELETWYDVEIAISDSELAARPVSTEIEGESLQQVLDLIALAVDARYERTGDTITLSSQ